jgi:pimeloyl-ACP methyl ester carboxylesterase
VRILARVVQLALTLVLAARSLGAQQPALNPFQFDPPGRLLDVGGRRIHFNCTGSGAPTVLLEAGASSFAIDWSLVQPEVARTSRVCSYDRAGHGWSEFRGEVDTPVRVVADLHAVLAAAGESPPFVMVGASFGALYVRLYQLDHPADVVGLVMVDPATEDRLFAFYQREVVAIATLTAEQLLTTLPRSAVPVPRRDPQTGPPFDKLPPDLYQLRIRFDERLIASVPPTVSAEVVREGAEGNRAMFARLLASRAAPESLVRNRPMIVLTRGEDMTEGIAENHAELARLSNNSRHAVVPGAGHEIHLFQPAVVIQAIQDVVTAARQRSSLPVRP